MDIYGALSGEPLTPKRLLEIKEEEAQKQYQTAYENSLTPNDKMSIETKLTNTVNKIKNDRFEYQKSLLLSPVSTNKNVEQYNEEINKLKIEVDENANPLFQMNASQYKTYANMLANSTDIDKTNNDMGVALIFSNTLGIDTETALKNKDQLVAQFAKGRWGNNPNLFEDLKTSFAIGRKSSDLSNLGNEFSKLEADMEGLEGDALAKQEELIQENIDARAELNNYIESHASYLDDGITRKLLRGFAQNAPQMSKIILQSAITGAAVYTGAALALPVIAGATTALGASAMFTASSLSLFGAATQTMMSSKELTQGSTYLNLREKGVSAKNARDAAGVIGAISGFTEVGFDAIPMGFVKTVFGKTAGNKILSSFVQKLAINPKLSKILLASGEALKSGAGEGLQEFTQSLTETIGTYMAESIEENGQSSIYEGVNKITKDNLSQAYEEAAMGFGLGLMMGSPSYIYNTKMDIKQYNQIKDIASNTDSKADFISKSAKITPETEHDSLGDLYDKFKENEDNTTVNDFVSPNLEDAKGTKSKAGESNEFEEKVDKSKPTTTKVELSPRSKTVKISGKDYKETTIFDSNQKKAGTIRTLTTGKNIEIVDIDINNTDLVNSTITELVAKYPDKDISWDTKGDLELEDIKQDLIENNPRGEDFGINYYDFSKQDQSIASKIKKPFNLNYEQSAIATSLVKLHAKQAGMTVNQWWNTNFDDIENVGLSSDKRGGIKFDPSKKDIKAVIYTAKNSDISTFTHEVFHLTISQMDNKGELAGYIKDWAKKEEFITFYNENEDLFDADFETTLKAAQEFDVNNNEWSVRQEELTASLYETWLKQGTTKVPELDSLMSKISEWFKEIYGAVRGTVKVNDDISNYFDSMYAQEDIDAEVNIPEQSAPKENISDTKKASAPPALNRFSTTEEIKAFNDYYKDDSTYTEKEEEPIIGFDSDEEAANYRQDKIEKEIEANKVEQEKERKKEERAKKRKQKAEEKKRKEDTKKIKDEVNRLLEETKKREEELAKIRKENSQSSESKRGEGEEGIKHDIKFVFDLSDKDAELAIGVIRARAKKEGYSVEEWYDRNILEIKKYTTTDGSLLGWAGRMMAKEDHTTFVKDGVKAYLHSNAEATKIADPLTTFVHEIFHISILGDANRYKLGSYIKDWVENDIEDFSAFYYEHETAFFNNFDRNFTKQELLDAASNFDTNDDNWTSSQEELAAMLYEIWFMEGGLKSTKRSKPISTLFKEISQKFIDEFGFFLGKTKLRKDISEYFENMYEEDTKITNKTLFQSTQSAKQKDERYLNAVETGDMETVQAMVDEAISEAVEKGIEILKPDGDVSGFKYHRGELPKKTKKSYAVFVANENGIEAAFAGKDGTTMPLGIWLDAEEIEGITSTTKKFSDGTFKKYIPGSTGATAKDSGINPTEYGLPKGQKFLFFRPGKHSSSLPNFSQMNVKDEITGKKQSAMPNNKIIFEIEIPVDVDFTEQMLEEAPKHPTTGKPMMRDAGLQRLPREGDKEGSYDYKTNPNAKGTWRISSAFKINRLVPYSEIVSKNEEAGIDVPKWNGGYTPEKYSLTEESVQQEAIKVKKLSDPIAYNKNGSVIPLSERFQLGNKTLFQSENRDLKKLNKDNSISIDENQEVVSMNLVDEDGGSWLFQANTRYKERKEAVIMASKFNSVVEFKEFYSQNSRKHQDVWYENVFKDGLDLAASESVESLYYNVVPKVKDKIFSNSLKSNPLVDAFIRQMKVFKRDVAEIDQSKSMMIEDRMKVDFYNEIIEVIPEEILNKTRLSKKSREDIRAINSEHSASVRNIYARLFGIEYMTDDNVFADTDYFEDTSTLIDASKITMAKALINFSEPETKQRLRENYKYAIANMEIHTEKLKSEIKTLKEKNGAIIKKLNENKEANKAEIAEIKAKQKADIKKLRENYELKLKDKDKISYYKGLKANIKKDVPISVRDDYARDIRAIQVLFDRNKLKSFETLEGGKWTPELVNEIIEKRMGSSFADMFDTELLRELADAYSRDKEKIYSTDDLEFFNILRNKLEQEGYELRKADIAERNQRYEFRRELLKETTNSSYKKIRNNFTNKLYKQLPPLRTFFSSSYNIERKAIMLDGFAKKGAFQSMLVDERRALKDREDFNTNKRMEKLTNVMKKNGVNFIDLTESVFETKYDGKVQKHSISDLFYYYYSQRNLDNRVAVSCGVLMTESERLNTETLTDEDFLEMADKRYKEVLQEAEKYVNNPKYSEIFDTIWKEFNNDSINTINKILLRTKNKQVKAINAYLPLVRKNFRSKEIQDQFDEDINGRQFYNTNTTLYGALIERQDIKPRNQQPVQTNMMSLLQTSVQKQEHLLAFYEYVQDMKAVFTSDDAIPLKNSIIDKFGEEMYSDIELFIDEVGNPYASKTEGHIDNLAKLLTGNLYPAYLGGKMSTITMQFITSPAAFKGKMGVTEYLGAFSNTLLHKDEVINKVNSLSPFMQNRSWDYSWSDIKKILQQMDSKKSKRLLQFESASEWLMGGLQVADTLTVYSGWMQLYKTELERLQIENSSASINENTKLAVKYADDFVRKTQPNSDIVEIAPIFKSGTASKIFTRFTASLSPIFQNTTFDSYQLWKNKEFKELFGMWQGYMIAGALLYAIKGGYDSGDDKEDITKKLLYSAISQPASSVPFIGNLVDYTFESIITGEKSGLYPTKLLPPIDSLLSSQRKFADGDFSKGIGLMAESIGLFTGLPVSAFKEYKMVIEEKSLLPLVGNKE